MLIRNLIIINFYKCLYNKVTGEDEAPRGRPSSCSGRGPARSCITPRGRRFLRAEGQGAGRPFHLLLLTRGAENSENEGETGTPPSFPTALAAPLTAPSPAYRRSAAPGSPQGTRWRAAASGGHRPSAGSRAAAPSVPRPATCLVPGSGPFYPGSTAPSRPPPCGRARGPGQRFMAAL